MVKKRVKFDITAHDKTQAAFRSVNAGLGRMGGAVAALGLGLLVRKTVQVAREFSILKASLKTVTGSTEAAGKAFSDLSAFAAETPFSVQQSTEAFIRLQSLGLKPSIAAMRSYGNTASAMGKDLLQFVEAIADATTGEFERLKEFGIKAKSVGDDVAFTFRGVTTQVGKNADEIEAYLRKIGDTDFAGAMAERAATIDGALSNLDDSVATLLNNIGEGGLSGGVSDLAKALSEAADGGSNFARMIGEASGKVLSFGADLFKLYDWMAGLVMSDPIDDTTAALDGLNSMIAGNIRLLATQKDLHPDRVRQLREEITLWDAQAQAIGNKMVAEKAADQSTEKPEAKTKTYDKAFDAQLKAHKRYLGQLTEEGKRITANVTPQSRYNARLVHLRELLDRNAIGQGVYTLEVGKARDAMIRQEEQALKSADAIGEGYTEAFGSAMSALDRFLGQGEFKLLDFGRLALNIFADVFNQQQSISGGRGGGGIGGFVSSLFGRERGGPVSAGQAYVVGEKRPEIFVPDRSGTILPSTAGFGGGTTINYNIDARGAERGVHTQIVMALQQAVARLDHDFEGRAIGAVAFDRQSGGPTSSPIGG